MKTTINTQTPTTLAALNACLRPKTSPLSVIFLIAVVILCLMFAAAVEAQIVRPPLVRTSPRILSVSELRQIKFAYQPPTIVGPRDISVTLSNMGVVRMAPVVGVMTPVTVPSPPPPEAAYKSAKGVVLGPGRWRDSITDSRIEAWHVMVDMELAPSINATSDADRVLRIHFQSAPSWERILVATYWHLPDGTHPYILTLNAEGQYPTVLPADSLKLTVGGTYSFTGSQLLISGNSIRVIFNYTPFAGLAKQPTYGNGCVIMVAWKPSPNPTYRSWFDFYSLQLAQLD
jgi:hypothetical protein